MKRLLFLLFTFCIIASPLLAQEEAETTDSEDVVVEGRELDTETAQTKYKEVSVSKFEDPGFWSAYIPGDIGIIKLRRFEGSPRGKESLTGEEEAGIDEADKYVLGAKVDFFKRSVVKFRISPTRPLPIEGRIQTLSVWVVGRELQHVLYAVVQDYFGNESIIRMGELNFPGWSKLEAAVPTTIKQSDPHFAGINGLRFVGFIVDCELTETYGSYYVYFDALRAKTDLFEEEVRDPDDIEDSW